MLGATFLELFIFDKNAIKGYKPSFYIQMVRIDDYYKQVKASGVKLTTELKTSSSNMREFSLADPDERERMTFGL